MIAYLVIGFIIFIITVIIYSCDEGSCSCGGLVNYILNYYSSDVVV